MTDRFFDVPNNLKRNPSDAERILSARHGCEMLCDAVEYKHYEPYYCVPNLLFDFYPTNEDRYD